MPSVLSFDVHPDNLVFNTEVPLINSPIGREEDDPPLLRDR